MIYDISKFRGGELLLEIEFLLQLLIVTPPPWLHMPPVISGAGSMLPTASWLLKNNNKKLVV